MTGAGNGGDRKWQEVLIRRPNFVMQKISVRKIIETVKRSGDIDSRFNAAFDSMHEGAAAHRKIQAEAGANYAAEVSLKMQATASGVAIILQGRADGIITTPDGFIIDEIKSTTLPLDVIFRQHESHLAQAKCYAFMHLQNLEKTP